MQAKSLFSLHIKVWLVGWFNIDNSNEMWVDNQCQVSLNWLSPTAYKALHLMNNKK